MLRAEFTPQFEGDSKKPRKKHVDPAPLKTLVALVLLDTPEARDELRRRRNMHDLKGDWSGSKECHTPNAGDWR